MVSPGAMPRTPKAGEACLKTARSSRMLLPAEDGRAKHGTRWLLHTLSFYFFLGA